MSNVIVYGADWCGMTRRTLAQLEDLGVDYEYINVEQDEQASAWVKEQNEGKEKKPTLKVAADVLCAPSNAELERILRAHQLIA
jgi:glutaredoxin